MREAGITRYSLLDDFRAQSTPDSGSQTVVQDSLKSYDKDARELVRRLLALAGVYFPLVAARNSLPRKGVAAVVERAGGVPLFVEGN